MIKRDLLSKGLYAGTKYAKSGKDGEDGGSLGKLMGNTDDHGEPFEVRPTWGVERWRG